MQFGEDIELVGFDSIVAKKDCCEQCDGKTVSIHYAFSIKGNRIVINVLGSMCDGEIDIGCYSSHLDNDGNVIIHELQDIVDNGGIRTAFIALMYYGSIELDNTYDIEEDDIIDINVCELKPQVGKLAFTIVKYLASHNIDYLFKKSSDE